MRTVLANALAAAPCLYDIVVLLLVRGAALRKAQAAALAVLALLTIFDVSVGFAGARLVLPIIVVAGVSLAVPPFDDVVVLAVSRSSPPLIVVIVVVIIGVVVAVLAPLRQFGHLLCFLIIVVLIHFFLQIFQCLDLALEYIFLLEALLKRAPGAWIT